MTEARSPTPDEPARYRGFWSDVGTHFPSLKGAVSTDYYAECERILLSDLLGPHLAGALLFKTDLWDEAKNTEILRWAAERGARVAGIDISLATARDAGEVLRTHLPGFVAGDVRAIPFADSSVDLIYSMGTIEHFPEYRQAIAEMHRILRPGGRAVIGVPNLFDPFLRPLMVAGLQRFGLYHYGDEKAFSARALRSLLEAAGFRVTARSGILFIPGWLRMADLWAHTRRSSLARLTGALVRPFAALYRRVPALRRHGYLLALLAEKPEATAARPVE
jgi:SAM-dependent methyltransferase